MSEMRVPTLHLIDDQRNRVDPEIADAVHSAYRWSLSKYDGKIDPTTLANFAEETGKRMAQKRSSIKNFSRYAFGAIISKSNQWWSKFGRYEQAYDPAILERLADPSHDLAFSSVEEVRFCQQLETLLQEKDREILRCICAKLTGDQIAQKLGITKDAARMRVKRVLDRIEHVLSLHAHEFRQKMSSRDYQIVLLNLRRVPVKEVARRLNTTVGEVKEVLRSTRARFGKSVVKSLPE